MTPRDVHKKYKIVDGHVKPGHKTAEVEGNFDRIVCNENGRFAGYLYVTGLSGDAKLEDRIRVYLPDGEYPKIDDLQFLLFKHVVITGKVTVKPDKTPNDGCNTEELQITVNADDKNHDIRILGESTSVKRVIIKHDKHPHKRRELPDGPLSIAVLSSEGSQGCNDFACVIDAKSYNKLNYFYLETFTPDEIIKTVDEIIEKSKEGEYNCLCIVRGGGPPESLAVFDDQDVVESVKRARKVMYIVTGIGHSNDSTECDKVADYCAYTPTDAAYFLNKS